MIKTKPVPAELNRLRDFGLRVGSPAGQNFAELVGQHANLGWFYAFAGRKNEAIREGSRSLELNPESKDAFCAIMNCDLALIYARIGEKDVALQLIARLLKAPGRWTVSIRASRLKT